GLGKYGDGRPYYAMRFVRGDSLEEAIESFYGKALSENRADQSQSRVATEKGSPTVADPKAAKNIRSGDKDQRSDPKGRKPKDSRSERAVEFRELLSRFIAVCNAVAYAHSRGILHRDIKPANIILGKYGETLVVDWGLAKVLGQSNPLDSSFDESLLHPGSGSNPTKMGSLVGTPAYMSPEQAAGQVELLTPASDVYSLGATLYCILTGQPPCTDKDVLTILEKVRACEFPRPRQVKKDVSPGLEAICLKAM